MANLQSGFPCDTRVGTGNLRDAGYEISHSGNGWGPGDFAGSGWSENPVGPKHRDFAGFHATRDTTRPFFFWLGDTAITAHSGTLPHRATARQVLDPAALVVPPAYPTAPRCATTSSTTTGE